MREIKEEMSIRKEIQRRIWIALEEARKSDVATAKVGAVLWSSSGVEICAHNFSFPSYDPRFPFLKELEYTTHAEASCILRALARGYDFRIGEWEILVVSPRKDGSLRDSRPCSICMRLIQAVGIKRIWYFQNGVLITEEI